MKRMMAQRNSFRLSANYDAVGFTLEQLSMLQEKDQTISDLQFSLDERTAQLEEVCMLDGGLQCVGHCLYKTMPVLP